MYMVQVVTHWYVVMPHKYQLMLNLINVKKSQFLA